jgi:hypothetical protein
MEKNGKKQNEIDASKGFLEDMFDVCRKEKKSVFGYFFYNHNNDMESVGVTNIDGEELDKKKGKRSVERYAEDFVNDFLGSIEDGIKRNALGEDYDD